MCGSPYLNWRGWKYWQWDENGQVFCTWLHAVVTKLETVRSLNDYACISSSILTLCTRQREGIGCDGGSQRGKRQTLSLPTRKLSWFAEPASSLYTVPSKRSVKPAFRALIPPGIWNITTDAKVIFVLSLQWGSRASTNRMLLSSLFTVNTNKDHSSSQWFHLYYKE